MYSVILIGFDNRYNIRLYCYKCHEVLPVMRCQVPVHSPSRGAISVRNWRTPTFTRTTTYTDKRTIRTLACTVWQRNQ